MTIEIVPDRYPDKEYITFRMRRKREDGSVRDGEQIATWLSRDLAHIEEGAGFPVAESDIARRDDA